MENIKFNGNPLYVKLYNRALDYLAKKEYETSYKLLLESIDDINSNVFNADLPITHIVNNNERPFTMYRQGEIAIPINIRNLQKIHLKAGRVAAILGKSSESLKHFENYQKTIMYGFEGDQIDMPIYSFRGFSEYSLADLSNNTISISRPKVLNDPFDTPILEWVKHQQNSSTHPPYISPFAKSFDGYRIRSFSIPKGETKPINNTLLWAHYADGHKGFCIEYDFSTDFRKRMISFNQIKYGNIDLNKDLFTIKDAFMTKSIDWKYENEVRLLSYDSDSESDYGTIPLDSESSISAIYFGIKCPPKRISVIKSLQKDSETKFYKMKAVGTSLPYKLIPELIK